MELGHLGGRYAKRRPACSSEAYPFITSRFIHINKMIGTEIRNKMKVLIPQLWISLSCLPLRGLLRPAFMFKSTANAGVCHLYLELVSYEKYHLIKVQIWFFK
jgi:hypothetical protein